LIRRLEAAAEPGFDIRLTFVREETPQALTLPGGQIMVTEGLLDIAESPDELAAVIAHEIGHVKHRDSMASLYRNFGFGVLLEAITGGTGVAQQAVVLGGQLAQLRYSREQEQRADRAALGALNHAGLDPGALADAFEHLKAYGVSKRAELRGEKADANAAHSELPDWFMSHPATEDRIAEGRRVHRTGFGAPALSPEAWETVRTACKADE
jgi:predicted Zn-dependent protease